MFTGLDPLVSVGAVLLLLFAGLSVLTRRFPSGALGGRRTQVSLTNTHAVHVVEVAGMRLLIGTGPSGAPRVLAELGPAEVATPEAARSGSWALAWQALLGRFEVGSGR